MSSADSYKTCKIEDVVYSIGQSTLSSLDVNFAADYVMHGVFIRLTKLNKVIVEEYGSKADDHNRKYFPEHESVKAAGDILREAYSIKNRINTYQNKNEDSEQYDLADLDYELMMLIGIIFKNWTNQTLPEPLEEEIHQHEIAMGEQEKREQEALEESPSTEGEEVFDEESEREAERLSNLFTGEKSE